MQLLEVQNLVFLIPLAFGIVLVLLMAFGMLGGDQDVHLEHGGVLDGLTGHGHGPHVDGHVGGGGAFATALSFFGIGKVPLAVIIVSGCMLWGVVGLALNTLFEFKQLWTPVWIAGGAAALGTRWVAHGLGRILPSVETYFVPADELVGEKAEVIHEINADGGTARLTDRLGTLRDISCRLPIGHPPVHRGNIVRLKSFDEASNAFTAEIET